MKNNFNNKILAISLGILMMTPFITHARKFFGTETGEIGVNELACGQGNFGTVTTTTTYVFGIAVSTSTVQTCYDGATGQQVPQTKL